MTDESNVEDQDEEALLGARPPTKIKKRKRLLVMQFLPDAHKQGSSYASSYTTPPTRNTKNEKRHSHEEEALPIYLVRKDSITSASLYTSGADTDAVFTTSSSPPITKTTLRALSYPVAEEASLSYSAEDDELGSVYPYYAYRGSNVKVSTPASENKKKHSQDEDSLHTYSSENTVELSLSTDFDDAKAPSPTKKIRAEKTRPGLEEAASPSYYSGDAEVLPVCRVLDDVVKMEDAV
jgi:hypothetical protein